MKKLALIIALVAAAACTRTVYAPAPQQPSPPVAPSAPVAAPSSPQYHHAQDLVLRSKAMVGAKCETTISTPTYDEAFCEMPNGNQLMCWHEQPGGMNCYTLYTAPPAPPVAPSPPVASPKPEPPKKTGK